MIDDSPKQPLSHIGPSGEARMVDVSQKKITTREAHASALVAIRPDVLEQLMRGKLPKGEALATARVAGILAAKRTSEWIPMCHPLQLEWIKIDFAVDAPGQLKIACTAKTASRTGVELEALTGAAAAALTIYDMAKAADRNIVIGPIQLERKTGGKSGTYQRTTDSDSS